MRNYLPIKNLAVTQTKKPLKKKKQSADFNESSAFESVRILGERTGLPDEDFT